jgi:hypothetical protein
MKTTVGRVVERDEPVALPAQLTATILASERLLRLAVLEQAVQDLRLARRIARASPSRLREDVATFLRDTEDWFESREDPWPYSFESLCTGLDVDPDSLRRRLRVGRSPRLRSRELRPLVAVPARAVASRPS